MIVNSETVPVIQIDFDMVPSLLENCVTSYVTFNLTINIYSILSV